MKAVRGRAAGSFAGPLVVECGSRSGGAGAGRL